MIHIVLNGEAREVATGSTLGDLVASLDLPADGIAAAIDRAVVPKSAYADTVLHEGAAIELIRAVGGG